MFISQKLQEATRSNGSARVVMLWDRQPASRPRPAIAIVANDTPYLVDFGTGVIRRATAAYEKGVSVRITPIGGLFLA
jgi:hypothetical protein